MYVLEYIFRHFLKICLKVHDWCCWKCVSYSAGAGPLCVRLDLDMIYEINTKLISKALLSVFCQVFCYFCRNAKKCPLLSFMRILSMEPSDRWNMSFSFFGKPYFCLQHAIIQCYLFTVEIFFKHCEELVFSSVGRPYFQLYCHEIFKQGTTESRSSCLFWVGRDPTKKKT